MSAERARLHELTAALKKNLEACAHDPEVEAVHNVRTGTRRIEAMLDTIVRELSLQDAQAEREDHAIDDAARKWLRLLKRIRRKAAGVRDLDVHRGLLKKQGLLKNDEPPPDTQPGPVEAADAVAYTLNQQAGDLDSWLRHARAEHAKPLMKAASKWSARLDGDLALFEAAIEQTPGRRARQRSAAAVALDAFARLSTEMQRLYEGNLHDFRKGAKKARYIAESGGDDPQAGAVGKALKKLQDEIGDWHDWLVLAEEAHEALGERGAELITLVEKERDRHYSLAITTTERMRGRLMGEWQALSPVRQRRTRASQNGVAEPRIP
ncbi:MAG: CHAD domain-containing protein [Silvibacterium sp.]|nr:CHAD domain-containing protein [Silvibacterium sp.]